MMWSSPSPGASNRSDTVAASHPRAAPASSNFKVEILSGGDMKTSKPISGISGEDQGRAMSIDNGKTLCPRWMASRPQASRYASGNRN
jgi:hypothetical protein